MAEKIAATYLIKNEEEYILDSLNSIKDLVDRIYIFDTGSTDKTDKLVKRFIAFSIDSGSIDRFTMVSWQKEKIDMFKNPRKLTNARQSMLNMARTADMDWMFIVDGHEVYPKESIENLKRELRRKEKKNKNYMKIYGWRFIEPNGYSKVVSRLARITPSLRWHKPFPREILVDDKGWLSVNNPKRFQDSKQLNDVFYHHYVKEKKFQWRSQWRKK